MTASRRPEPDFEPRVRVVEGENCQRTLEVELPADYVRAVQAAVLQRYRSQVKLRGFRKGRAPAGAILRRHGTEMMAETVEIAAEGACRNAIEAKGLRPVTDVNIGQQRSTDDGGLAFTATFEVAPSVRLARLGGFRLRRPPVDRVDDDTAGAVIERLRRSHAAWRPEEGAPSNGDQVTVAMEHLGGDESRDYELILGRGQALPDVERAIRSLSPGESGEFDIAFPRDHPDEERAGTSHRMKITLQERRVAELPELDDDFARLAGDFEDMEEVRARILETLQKEARARSERRMEAELMRTVVEANPFDVPSSMVDRYLEGMMSSLGVDQDSDADELADRLRPQAEFGLRRDLVIGAIGEEHDLKPSREEVNEQVADLAREAGVSPSVMRSRLRGDEGIERIETGMTEVRVMAFLKERSEIA